MTFKKSNLEMILFNYFFVASKNNPMSAQTELQTSF